MQWPLIWLISFYLLSVTFVLSQLSFNYNVSVALYVMILTLCYFTDPIKDQKLLFNNQL